MQTRGLRVSVLKSRAPVEVELGFRSPYGYMIVDLILDFDWYARVVKTMVQKNRLAEDATVGNPGMTGRSSAKVDGCKEGGV